MIYILTKLQYSNIQLNALNAALNATTEKRGSKEEVKDYHRIMDTVRNSEVMQKQWDNYQKDFEYATDIEFEDTCDTVVKLMDRLTEIWKFMKTKRVSCTEQYKCKSSLFKYKEIFCPINCIFVQ